MRRLLILASTMVFFDVAFYAAIAPLLPDYVAESRPEQGGGRDARRLLCGRHPARLAAGRAGWRPASGPRRTVIGGLLLLGVASLVFGFGRQHRPARRGALRPGDRRGADRSGALTWLITASPDERRGSVIGTALGTAVAGALLGPSWERSPPKSAPSSSSASCCVDRRRARPRSPPACRRRAAREAAAARGRRGDAQPPGARPRPRSSRCPR